MLLVFECNARRARVCTSVGWRAPKLFEIVSVSCMRDLNEGEYLCMSVCAIAKLPLQNVKKKITFESPSTGFSSDDSIKKNFYVFFLFFVNFFQALK